LLVPACACASTSSGRGGTMLNNAMGVTDDRSTKVGHYVATLAVVAL